MQEESQAKSKEEDSKNQDLDQKVVSMTKEEQIQGGVMTQRVVQMKEDIGEFIGENKDEPSNQIDGEGAKVDGQPNEEKPAEEVKQPEDKQDNEQNNQGGE